MLAQHYVHCPILQLNSIVAGESRGTNVRFWPVAVISGGIRSKPGSMDCGGWR